MLVHIVHCSLPVGQTEYTSGAQETLLHESLSSMQVLRVFSSLVRRWCVSLTHRHFRTSVCLYKLTENWLNTKRSKNNSNQKKSRTRDLNLQLLWQNNLERKYHYHRNSVFFIHILRTKFFTHFRGKRCITFLSAAWFTEWIALQAFIKAREGKNCNYC